MSLGATIVGAAVVVADVASLNTSRSIDKKQHSAGELVFSR
jgi:hypothetical protein